MGYESDVAVCWLAADHKRLAEEAGKAGGDGKWALFRHCDETRETSDGKYTITVWRGIKWYSGDPRFPEVAWIEELLDRHTSLFVRIGEETEDIEIKRTELEGCDGESFTMESHLCVARSLLITD